MNSKEEAPPTSNDPSQDTKHHNQPFTRFHEIELSNYLNTINSIQNRRTQMGTFFGTISLGILSIAFGTQLAGLFFVAGILMFFYAYLDMIERSFIIDFFFRYLHLREKFLPDDKLVHVYFYEDVKEELQKIVEEPNPEKQTKALRELSRSSRTANRSTIPIAIGVVEIILGIFLWQSAAWPLF